jgi:GAF domain-containing protein
MCNVPEKDIVFPRDTWGTSTWCEAIKKKRWFYSNEPSKVPEGHIPISRHISMPIVYQDESIGLLQVANRETDYDEQDIQLLHSIAEYMAPVLNARLQRDRQEEARKRTEEALAQQVEELESFHRLAVGRELRMIELKRQVNELSEQLGREAPYDLSLLE